MFLDFVNIRFSFFDKGYLDMVVIRIIFVSEGCLIYFYKKGYGIL